MLKMIEKLINEHGSSVILKERLQLFSDKYELLENQNQVLKDNNELLESKLDRANESIKELKTKVNELESDNKPEELNESEINILKFLFDTNSEYEPKGLASQFKMPIGVMEYHLKKLENLEFIYCHLAVMAPITYQISHDGQAYVVENGI